MACWNILGHLKFSRQPSGLILGSGQFELQLDERLRVKSGNIPVPHTILFYGHLGIWLFKTFPFPPFLFLIWRDCRQHGGPGDVVFLTDFWEQSLSCSFNLCGLPAGNALKESSEWKEDAGWASGNRKLLPVSSRVEESEEQRENSLHRNGKSRWEWNGRRGCVGITQEQKEATKSPA